MSEERTVYVSKTTSGGRRTVHGDRSCRHLKCVDEVIEKPESVFADWNKKCKECFHNNDS